MEVLSSRVILPSTDLERSRSFYQDTLGLHVSREYGDGGTVLGVVFFLGGGFLELVGRPGHPSGAEPGTDVKLWLQVPDVVAEERRLRALGVTVLKPAERMPWGLHELWIADPDDVELRLVEVPPDHPLRRRLG